MYAHGVSRDQELAQASAWLDAAASVVVVTGAGISAESGISTFRGGMHALWADFKPEELATPEAFAANPARVTSWYDWRRLKCLEAEPNPGHVALAAIERRLCQSGRTFLLITQNVDGLHQRAGSERVIEIHGSIHRWSCSSTRRRAAVPHGPFPSYPPIGPWQAPLRPDVVWFGEALPDEALQIALAVIASSDLFLSIGTSSQVYPVAGFRDLAARAGARTIEINPEPTPASGRFDLSIRGRAGEVLPRIIQSLAEGVQNKGDSRIPRERLTRLEAKGAE